MNNESEKTKIELYRCHPKRGGGIIWAISFLIVFGMPIYSSILENNLWPLFFFWLPFGWFMILSLEQAMWQLFGEEIGSIDDDCFYIHRKNRMFNRNWRIHLYKIDEMDYYKESVLKRLFLTCGFANNTLYLRYSPSLFQHKFAPGLPSDEQVNVIDRLGEAVAIAKAGREYVVTHVISED